MLPARYDDDDAFISAMTNTSGLSIALIKFCTFKNIFIYIYIYISMNA